ncbi:unnamed protein product [Closterium sp. Naga37s-1]|nr:unnamed protein product [Closterium sp. Naga37s-1]
MQGGATASPTEVVLTSNVELTADCLSYSPPHSPPSPTPFHLPKLSPASSTFFPPPSTLPALSGAAKLTIRGACATSRCIISGGGAFPIFTSPSTTPKGGKLTLVNLRFQQAAGGVFKNVRTAINASQCIFVNNTVSDIGGGVLSDSFPPSTNPPKHVFSNCTFEKNTAGTWEGGAITIKAKSFYSYKHNDRVPDLTFRSCHFRSNNASRLGGAVSVAGSARVRFFDCVFSANRAGASGGAVYSKDAAIYFGQSSFSGNAALGTSLAGGDSSGVGGAVYAVVTGVDSETAAEWHSDHEWVVGANELPSQVRKTADWVNGEGVGDWLGRECCRSSGRSESSEKAGWVAGPHKG